MERACFRFRLRPGHKLEYRRRHDEIWPEMVQALRDSGVANYTIFLDGDELIAFAECEPDARTAFGAMAATEVDQRWSKEMDAIISDLTGDDGELHYATEVWHME
jgi:L-rhamnose mutarotase